MTSGRRITVEADPRQRADRRACVSLLVLGILTLLMFGSMESAILRQSEGLGMGVAFMIIPLVIPFAIALVWALVFSSQALSKGSRAFPKCLVIWCIAAAVFIAQLVRPYRGRRSLFGLHNRLLFDHRFRFFAPARRYALVVAFRAVAPAT